MKNTFPANDLQRHASRIVNYVKNSPDPVIITQRGRASAVLLSPEAYDRIEKDLKRLGELKSNLLIAQSDYLTKPDKWTELKQRVKLIERRFVA